MIIPLRNLILNGKSCARCKSTKELDWNIEPLDVKGLQNDAKLGKIDSKNLLCHRCRMAKEISTVKVN